jgi:ATPase subunit of ABC transporter with duplicated ATPase domains
VLEDALNEFDGTVLVISHDRYFLDRVVNRIVELQDGALVEYVGNYSDYQAAKAGR